MILNTNWMQNTTLSLPWTGERFIPSLSGDIALEHLHRYFMASEFIQNKVVLDIACGEGYGANFLAQTAEYVFGVDIAEEVISFAKNKYQKSNLEFKVGNCADIPLPDHFVDVVVSFETIEHHGEHEKMIAEIKRILRPDGILIISSPDKYEYSDVPGFNNAFHIKELYKNELEELLRTHFINIHMFGQRVALGSNIACLEEAATGEYITFASDQGHLTRTQGIYKPLYFIAMASNAKLPKIQNSIFENQNNNTFSEEDTRNENIIPISHADDLPLNSVPWLNRQFENVWEQTDYYRNQTVFFANISIQYSPSWFIDSIEKNKLSLCDFGCALGDGVATLLKRFPSSKVLGIDIAAAAICRAKVIHQEIAAEFKCIDIGEDQEKYDVIFSSNTLEHFYDPWCVLNKLAHRAEKFIWLLLPLGEDPLPEHFYSFEYSNIQCQIANDFQLIFVSEIHTSLLSPPFWGGKQILLIYASPKEVRSQAENNILLCKYSNDYLRGLG